MKRGKRFIVLLRIAVGKPALNTYFHFLQSTLKIKLEFKGLQKHTAKEQQITKGKKQTLNKKMARTMSQIRF